MKKKLTTINLTRLILLLTLSFTFSCSEDVDGIENSKEQNTFDLSELPSPEEIPEKDNDLQARVQGKQTTQPCDNPEGYKEYTADEVLGAGVTDVNGVRPILDDRTCAYNYSQTNVANVTYGRYRLRAGTNAFDNKQPRIERASVAANSNAPGTKVTFNGTVRVWRVGDATNGGSLAQNNSGTYICQAKGKDTRTSGQSNNSDPALALLLVKPVSGTGSNQTRFRFYVEHMQNGAGALRNSTARYIDNLNFDFNRGEPIQVTMVNEFAGSCNNLVHRVIITLRGKDVNGNPRNLTRTYNIPEPTRGTQAKIRFGAYRCWGGEADIRWASGVSMNSVVGGSSCSNNSSNNGGSNWDPSRNFAPTSFNRRSSSYWYEAAYPAASVMDGNYNSYWASANFNTTTQHWMIADHNRFYTLKRAKVVFNARVMRDFDILYYNNGWKVAKSVRGNYSNTVMIEGINAYGHAFGIQSIRGAEGYVEVKELELYDY
ncbi:hypothetical protein [Algibacter pacificus]|uniref:hypothetical protein n=1 Tax=Algibacter pacificus TaxID=2599389 RepID=UPI0011C8E51C|nr:hypothetical protein [Algibacter pacificus]